MKTPDFILRQMQQNPDKKEFSETEMQEFKTVAREYGDRISSEADRMYEKHGFYILAQYDEDTNSLIPSEFPITEFKEEK